MVTVVFVVVVVVVFRHFWLFGASAVAARFKAVWRGDRAGASVWCECFVCGLEYSYLINSTFSFPFLLLFSWGFSLVPSRSRRIIYWSIPVWLDSFFFKSR